MRSNPVTCEVCRRVRRVYRIRPDFSEYLEVTGAKETGKDA
jgi:hypothetical protein